jgi:signal recognition particle subunit SRP54
MVLGELGNALAGALKKLGEHTVVDEEVMDACLKEAGTGVQGSWRRV